MSTEGESITPISDSWTVTEWHELADWLITALANAYDRSRASMADSLAEVASDGRMAALVNYVGNLP